MLFLESARHWRVYLWAAYKTRLRTLGTFTCLLRMLVFHASGVARAHGQCVYREQWRMLVLPLTFVVDGVAGEIDRVNGRARV